MTSVAAQTSSDLLPQEAQLNFEHITVDDGLPENSVRAILQDQHGFMWLGTQNGLVRYDGQGMTVFLPDAEVAGSFGGRTVDALYEDRAGWIWIGTFLRGVWRYDDVRGEFRHIGGGRGPTPEADAFHVADISEDQEGRLWFATEHGLASLAPGEDTLTWPELAPPPGNASTPYIHLSVLADDQGRVWCGTEGDGLARFDPATGRTRWFLPEEGRPRSLPAPQVRDIHQAFDRRIWIATDDGLCLWQEASNDFRVFRAGDEPAHEAHLFIAIAAGDHGLMWLGSASGLYAFAPATGQLRLFPHRSDRPTSPVTGPILSVAVDRSGLVWAGSWHTGLNKVDPAAGWFRRHTFSLPVGSSRRAAVDAVLEDRHGNLVVGVSDVPRGRGLGLVYRSVGAGGQFQALPVAAEDEPLTSVRSLCEDGDGTVWIGTWKGLWKIDAGVVVPVAPGTGSAAELLRRTTITGLAVDIRGHLWMATTSGAFRWDRQRDELQHFSHDPDDPGSISAAHLESVHVDRTGRVWFGADARGLSLFLGEKEGFVRFFDSERGIETVSDIHETADGMLWLATYSGLIRFDPATGETTLLDRRRGLPNDEVAAILEDARGRFWLSTGFGLASVAEDRATITSYDTRDGLPDNQVRYSNCRRRDGTLHFGGAHGMVSFDPAHFASSTYEPSVAITEITLSDLPLGVGGASPLSVLPHLVGRLVLRHDQNDLGLRFAALDYARPDRNRYRFMLEGVDDHWRVPGPERQAVYVNLPPGDYTFRVTGSNRDGIFSDHTATLRVSIEPPWWSTWWAKAAYGVLALLLILVVVRQLTMRERMRAKLDLQRAEAEKLQELDELKSHFLTNITHEFRTPLTLIKVPLTRMRAEQGEGADGRFATMLRNANRLEQLIDQLLDLSRLEAGRLPLKWRQGDCGAYLGIYVSAFESLAAQRDIDLTVRIPEEPCHAWYDADLLEKLVGNLLSNALKHTPDEGQVVVLITAGPGQDLQPPRSGRALAGNGAVQGRMLAVAVTNTGSYIPPADRIRIFDRFQQASSIGGTGVGLALVKELTERLGGTIDLASDPDRGTCFTATVPVFLVHPEGEESGPAETEPAAGNATEEDLAAGPDPEDADGETDATIDESRILVVEDHPDLRAMMAADLAADYRVLEAADGAAGLELAIAEVPDLILSDVMMPGMDGFELCRRLKEDERTSHVPVILLTARSEAESRHTGLRSGADDYLAKPFDTEDLHLRIHNLIEQRRRLAERYERKMAVLSPDAMPVTSSDERFVVELRKTIDDHLDDPDYRTSDLCGEVAMSRSQLHRKLKALTGKSTTDFVRTHRLLRAVQLFDGGYGNVTEVAYAVGFRNLSYFARSFRDLVGVPPSEYLRDGADRTSSPAAGED